MVHATAVCSDADTEVDLTIHGDAAFDDGFDAMFGDGTAQGSDPLEIGCVGALPCFPDGHCGRELIGVVGQLGELSLGTADLANGVAVVALEVLPLVPVDATPNGTHGVERRRGAVSPAHGLVEACSLVGDLPLHFAQLDGRVWRSLAEGVEEAMPLGLQRSKRGTREAPIVAVLSASPVVVMSAQSAPVGAAAVSTSPTGAAGSHAAPAPVSYSAASLGTTDR